jgi:hypothetical protein
MSKLSLCEALIVLHGVICSGWDEENFTLPASGAPILEATFGIKGFQCIFEYHTHEDWVYTLRSPNSPRWHESKKREGTSRLDPPVTSRLDPPVTRWVLDKKLCLTRFNTLLPKAHIPDRSVLIWAGYNTLKNRAKLSNQTRPDGVKLFVSTELTIWESESSTCVPVFQIILGVMSVTVCLSVERG